MPNTTPTYLMPYPLLTDTPDVPRDVKALADRLEAYLAQLAAATTAAAAVVAADRPLAFHGTASGTVPAGMGIVSVGAITMSGAAVTSGYVAGAIGNNSMRLLRPCVVSLTALFYDPATGDKQGAIGVGGITWWWAGASSADRVSGSLAYPFTAVTDIILSQRGAGAANTSFTVDGYLIPMD